MTSPTTTDEVVADYVRAALRVPLPETLVAEVMRTAAATPQARRPWFHAFLPFAPALAGAGAVGVIVAVGLLLSSPRDVGPAPDASGPSPSGTPRPTLTPEDARILTEPGDVIVMPAFDSQGQFGTITLERGEERASYEGYVPLQALMSGEVFFVEIFITYQVDRPTDASYGAIDIAWAVDADGDGLDADDAINQHLGYDMDGGPLETGPDPLLPFAFTGTSQISGWLALELPAAGAEHDVYLVQLAERAGADPSEFAEFEAASSALVREPGPPVGVTAFDPDAPPESLASVPPLENIQRLPSPAPEPLATFAPTADADADDLLADPERCTNDELGVAISYPRGWHTNDAYEDMPACTLFDEEPIDAELVYHSLTTDRPAVLMHLAPEWLGGATDQPNVALAEFARVPYGDRIGWLITYADQPLRQYLVPLTDDPYGPFLRTVSNDETRAIVERMVLLLEFDE